MRQVSTLMVGLPRGRVRLFLSRLWEFDELPPPDIIWFERLWLGTLALSVIVTITMFDWSTDKVGRLGAALLTTIRFAGSYVLMFVCSRMRSNIARWVIAVPFLLTIIAYDLIRLPDMLDRDPIIYVVVARLALTFAAAYMLFTPQSRAWFARRPPPLE